MGIKVEHLRKLIQDSLPDFLYSRDAEELLIATAAHETFLGYFLYQEGGPALGIYQMEPKTENDLWNNFIYYKLNIRNILPDPIEADLEYDLKYQTIMARLLYYRVPEDIPNWKDLEGIARYWKKWWNTPKGKGTIEDFKRNYRTYVLKGE